MLFVIYLTKLVPFQCPFFTNKGTHFTQFKRTNARTPASNQFGIIISLPINSRSMYRINYTSTGAIETKMQKLVSHFNTIRKIFQSK